MSTKDTHSRNQKLREVAILVASLDEHWAQRLLDSMPAEDALAVREAVELLGPVDAEEQRKIVEKFRQSTAPERPAKIDGVELDASLLARFEEEELSDSSPTLPTMRPLESLTDAEATTVVDMLSAEHPQTIAMVLSRLAPESAGVLLSKFTAPVQADVLARMANCDTADEYTVHVVESQLSLWIDQHRQQRQRMAAGLELVERIIGCTPESQRKIVLTLLGKRDPGLAGRLEKSAARIDSPKPIAARIGKWRGQEPLEPTTRPVTPAAPTVPKVVPLAKPVPPPTGPIVSSRPVEDLDRLDDTTILAALSRTERQVAILALAGASETLMKRVLRGLPRSQARKMRRQLRDIGPTRLGDILAAQQELLESARQLLHSKHK